MDGGDKVVNVVYTATEYTVTFKNGEETVATETYTVESTEITVPEVPAKAGFTGVWEAYELNGGDITVNAIYTEIPDDSTPDDSTPDDSIADSSTTDSTNGSSISGPSSSNDGCAGALNVGLTGVVTLLGVAFLCKKNED